MAYRESPEIAARKAELREKILNAAQQLVSEGGFRNASIQSVAQRADIATGTVYKYFKSKSVLFSEVFRRATQIEVDKVAEAINQEGTISERLEQAVNCFCHRAIKANHLAWSLIAEPVDPEVDLDRLNYRKKYAALFANLIAEGVDKGELPTQVPSVSAAALVGALAETLVGPLSPNSPNSPVFNANINQDETLSVDETLTLDESALIREISRFCHTAISGHPPPCRRDTTLPGPNEQEQK
ncbi:MAG: TetR/AcrR family transcriptional regulator [Pseudomonadales bacterium]|uniref:TetR family transcriptional regulator n=1 Tax=Oleiphilus messinensis TaxID=141451 RepID=A0A1Y0IDH7_9GAMM|nr:TetR/AcrR family transcriptional regulator [Oleiphilus messinensis]ARU58588.1 TetR family transcriptional regulator [Oleiphilus messinensis]MCG8609204.1 TetR/AcrR family transcriptional regulator [Pseudomonadales bacterium]